MEDIMSDNEFRLVTRQESFNDLAVRELAKGRAACICKLQFGRCTKNDCKYCRIHAQYSACYSQMNEYDRQRLSTYISENYVRYSYDPSQWMSFSGYLKHIGFIIFMCVIVPVILLIGLVFLTVGIPDDKPVEPEIDEHIEYVMHKVKTYVHDINGDGLVNCIDHAVLFKIYWDEKYPNQKTSCIIIRNKKPAPYKMHHLFIGIDTGHQIIEVEPRAKNYKKYLMADNWSTKYYNRNYNIYWETNKWLKEYKR